MIDYELNSRILSNLFAHPLTFAARESGYTLDEALENALREIVNTWHWPESLMFFIRHIPEDLEMGTIAHAMASFASSVMVAETCDYDLGLNAVVIEAKNAELLHDAVRHGAAAVFLAPAVPVPGRDKAETYWYLTCHASIINGTIDVTPGLRAYGQDNELDTLKSFVEPMRVSMRPQDIALNASSPIIILWSYESSVDEDALLAHDVTYDIILERNGY